MALLVYTFLAAAVFLNVNLLLLDQMAADYTTRAMKAFYIAEAGLAYAVAYCSEHAIDPRLLLAGEDGIGGPPHDADDGLMPFGRDVPFAGGRFTVRVKDNREPDGDLYRDADNVLVLYSEASLDPGTRKTLMSVIRCPPPCTPTSWLDLE